MCLEGAVQRIGSAFPLLATGAVIASLVGTSVPVTLALALLYIFGSLLRSDLFRALEVA